MHIYLNMYFKSVEIAQKIESLLSPILANSTNMLFLQMLKARY